MNHLKSTCILLLLFLGWTILSTKIHLFIYKIKFILLLVFDSNKFLNRNNWCNKDIKTSITTGTTGTTGTTQTTGKTGKRGRNVNLNSILIYIPFIVLFLLVIVAIVWLIKRKKEKKDNLN